MSLEDRLYPLLWAYDRMPRVAQHSLGLVYRAIPERIRFGSSYANFVNSTQEAESWSSEECWNYQRERLSQVLSHAYKNCPYYAKRFAEATFEPTKILQPADLLSCPFTTKEDLLRQRESMVATNFPKSHRLYITTGGSTGVPVGFYLHRGISRPKEQAFLESMWSRAGYRSGMRLAVIRGHVVNSKSSGRISFYDATRNWLLLSSYHLTEERLPQYLESLERFRPDMLHAYPSALLQLAEYLERSDQLWRIPLAGILCGSERLNLPQKRLIERVFGARAFRWYGHSERVVLAGEGRRSELFHFWPNYGYVEFGEPDETGMREVIGTSFHNLVMPLVRYRTGDFVRLATSENSMNPEFPWPAVVEIAGREQEFLVSQTGRRISLTAFNMHDGVFDNLYAVQFFQDEPGKTEFRYVPSPQFHSSRLHEIEKGIRRKLGDDFILTMKAVSETEKTARGKHCWIVSRLSQATPKP